MDVSEPRVFAARAHDADSAAPAGRAVSRQDGYVRQTADIVRAQMPWAMVAFLLTYYIGATLEVSRHPDRLGVSIVVCSSATLVSILALLVTRAPGASPRRCRLATIAMGLVLMVLTTLYHIWVRGPAELLALSNLYLMIGFLAAFPWGGGPQLVMAVAAFVGVLVGVLTTVTTSIAVGMLFTGMLSLGGLSVASAVLTDRYRHRLFQAQQQLQMAMEAAERASQARRDFVASVSHDLRTPVNIIFGMADMALDVAVTAEQRELVETIKRSAGQLHALLNDLLDFSKIDAGVVDLSPRRFTVRPWLDTVLEGPQRQAAGKHVLLDASIDPEVPEAIVSDPDRLRQVLGNLVGNAVKFTDSGAVRVRLRATGNGGRPRTLRCEVRDTGIGIAPSETARLFEPFSQAAETSRSHGGSGLGLAICKRLTEQMGGTIGVDSTPGRGSTFWFTVPIDTPAAVNVSANAGG